MTVEATVLAIALAGCGGDSPDVVTDEARPAAAEARLVDPCTLLTAEEVSQVLGWAGAQTTSDTTSTPGHGNCTFEAIGQDERLWLYLNAQSSMEPDRNTYREGAEQYESLGMENLQFIDGLGSAAMWAADVRQLAVRVPYYEISVIDMTASGVADLNLTQARALMDKALARLP